MYHVGDEFFKEVFQELLGGQQRGLVQLLLPQVVVIVHRLQRNMKEKVSVKRQDTGRRGFYTRKQKKEMLNDSYLCMRLVDV